MSDISSKLDCKRNLSYFANRSGPTRFLTWEGNAWDSHFISGHINALTEPVSICTLKYAAIHSEQNTCSHFGNEMHATPSFSPKHTPHV